MICAVLLLLLGAVSIPVIGAEQPARTPEALITAATKAYNEHKLDEAVRMATEAVSLAPTNHDVLFYRGRLFGALRRHEEAIRDLDRVIALEPKAAAAYQERGQEHFKIAHIKESLADFDRSDELVPQQKAHNWQRGIACYYADKFEEGKKQFELHLTVNPNDVENAVWHYLCVARFKGLDQAKKSLIAIRNDARVPMMQVHALFAGKATPEQVLEAAEAKASPAKLRDQLFFAHLYLGLYFEAAGDMERSRTHILKATDEFSMDHYMGDVARVHKLLRFDKPKQP